jgi:hypothetical protein
MTSASPAEQFVRDDTKVRAVATAGVHETGLL